MLSKLFKGEFGLGVTFWKYGILALIVMKLIVRLFGSLLQKHIQGVSIADFFLHHFHPIYSSKFSILWTLCYLSGLLVMALYTYNITIGLWKSSSEYDKSLWLRHLARILFIIFVIAIWGSMDFLPLF